ncbi:MAG: regulatory iron-sulfur-containing complex subunit RicT [Flavobacteriales bacterium]|jgi:cell fate regulator YaaT (PSP1 superfamily)|nr:regulatory iron-sulfur-containing complex subunit RicT [Flavobacteriales bacterium]
MGCSGCGSGVDGKPAGCGNKGYCSTSGCNKLGVFDWLTGVPLPTGQQPFDGVEVRFKNTRKGFYRNSLGLQLMPGDLVTVDAAPGHDVGMVSLTGELVRAQMQRRNLSGDTFELRKVLRKSTQEDIDRWHAVRQLEDETMFAARGMVREARLDMKVTDVEHQADGTKAVIYYTAEERIDFRGLVRTMADRFKVRVEMRQIGARQEAGRIGGIGSCGRELCCSTWLTDFRSVTTSAARYQQLALNPQKLAGQCGKLKCCLNYELDMYIEAVKSYPSQNAKLKTRQGTGSHIKTDIFTGRMWYGFKRPGEPFTMAGFPVETVREILEQNKRGEVPEVDLNMGEEPKAADRTPDYENVVGQDDLTRFDGKIKSGRKKRKGKPRKERDGARPAVARPTKPARPGKPGADAAPKPGGDRRRRRGRGPKDGGPTNQPPAAS